MHLLSFFDHIVNLIYPNVCGICDKISKEDLCKKCENELNNIAKNEIDIYRNKNFRKHLYIFKYDGIIRKRLISYKFNDKPYIYKSFIKFFLKNKKICRFLKSYDIIIPVPIHYFRKVDRGYNQSELIAKKLAKKLGLECEKNVLIKLKNNKPQSTESRLRRTENVLDVYCIRNKEKIINKKIILFDDIYTTGSTVNECAKMLIQSGAKEVDVFTLAKD